MMIDEHDEVIDEEMYTDTSMFDADEIVRSVEEVARQRQADPQMEKRLSARQRFEMLMEQRRLAENLGDEFADDDWPDEDEL